MTGFVKRNRAAFIRYPDEQAFRFNERDDGDGNRFRKVVSSVAGKRLTYVELTGKNGEASS